MSSSILEPDDDSGYATLGAARFMALRLPEAYRRLRLLAEGRMTAPEQTERDIDDARNFCKLMNFLYLGASHDESEPVEAILDRLPDDERLEARVLIEHYFL